VIRVEFDKEELNIIYQSVCDRQINISQGLMKQNVSYERIIKKIKNMVDNYCEHPENMRMFNLGTDYCVKCKLQLNGGHEHE
jgi:phosphorylcholine metabolism protein LicD